MTSSPSISSVSLLLQSTNNILNSCSAKTNKTHLPDTNKQKKSVNRPGGFETKDVSVYKESVDPDYLKSKLKKYYERVQPY